MDSKAKLQIDHAKNQMRTEIAASRAKAELEAASPILFNSGGPGSRISVSRILLDANKGKPETDDVKFPRLGLKFSPLSDSKAHKEESEFSDVTVLSTPGSHTLKTEHIRKIGTEFQTNLVDGERPTKSLLRVFHGHLGPVTSVDILQIEGKEYLFCGSVDRTCRMYDTDTTQCLQVFEGHVGIVTSVFAAKIYGSFREIKVSRMLPYQAESLWDDEEADILEFKLNSISKKVEFHAMYRQAHRVVGIAVSAC
jgi:WD40 repeat protein